MQFIVISHQLLECLWALLLGAFFGLVYDVLRFITRLFSTRFSELLLKNITDLLYLLFCSASYCVFLYSASNGRFRFFTFLSLAFGFVLYRLLPGKIIDRFLELVSRGVRLILKWILYPFRCLGAILKRGATLIFLLMKRKRNIRKTERIKKQLPIDVKI